MFLNAAIMMQNVSTHLYMYKYIYIYTYHYLYQVTKILLFNSYNNIKRKPQTPVSGAWRKRPTFPPPPSPPRAPKKLQDWQLLTWFLWKIGGPTRHEDDLPVALNKWNGWNIYRFFSINVSDGCTSNMIESTQLNDSHIQNDHVVDICGSQLVQEYGMTSTSLIIGFNMV